MVLRYLVHVVGTCCIGTRVFIVGTFTWFTRVYRRHILPVRLNGEAYDVVLRYLVVVGTCCIGLHWWNVHSTCTCIGPGNVTCSVSRSRGGYLLYRFTCIYCRYDLPGLRLVVVGNILPVCLNGVAYDIILRYFSVA